MFTLLAVAPPPDTALLPTHQLSEATSEHPMASAVWHEADFIPIARDPGFNTFVARADARIWFLEADDIDQQNALFARLAHWLGVIADANAPLPSADEIRAWSRQTGADPRWQWIGHDYQMSEVRAFFYRAETDGVVLNTAEQLLRARLDALGLLTDTVRDGVLIAVPRASTTPHPARLTPAQQRALLRHELSHAEFYLNPSYRAYCLEFWARLMPEVRTVIRERFGRWCYDIDDTERLANELQAYLFEQEMGIWLDLDLRPTGISLAALREEFLAGLDALGTPTARFFQNLAYRQPLARGNGWNEDQSLRKISQ